jgi:hypothetical protein
MSSCGEIIEDIVSRVAFGVCGNAATPEMVARAFIAATHGPELCAGGVACSGVYNSVLAVAKRWVWGPS